ncbi:HMG domain-containing protein 3 isoform X2 [Salmo salar]|uniref:HMG domain-containing protein 3 isoform X2 n=1 Tax=Salmo salar TaxID=8030 RepID=A0ABM3F9J8_SALSA|nr:HMG domain-containing protein 3 isoform X2 [Salmo salar]|eukprot:XP_014067970.1 PREDICTED: HMG domain-containing protein 3 isoform X3 [Salmo salar]
METMEVYEETDRRMTEEVESCYTLMEVTSPKKRKKNKAQQGEIMEKPKKPRSAYLLYYFDVHQTMQQEFPSLPQSEINKRISVSWKRLNVADKGYYLEKAKLEKEGMDTSSMGPSQELPGFRRILPRANYVLLPKAAMSDDRTGSQLEVCMEGLDSAVGEGVMPSLSLGSPQYPPLVLGCEVELSEQCIAIEGLTDEKAVTLTHSGALQGVLSSSYHSSSSVSAAHESHNAPHLASAGLLLKEEEPRMVGGGYSVIGMATDGRRVGGTAVQHVKTELVTIIPNQDLMEHRTLPGASSVASVVMVPVGARVIRDTNPSYKLSNKYTRRGRGSCQTAGCSFVYVTRHKPPFCPDCGNHLGGKWVPAAVKTPGAAASFKTYAQKPPTNPGDPPKTSVPPSDDQNIKMSGWRKGGRGPREPRGQVQQRAVTPGPPLEGGRAISQGVIQPAPAVSGTQTTMITLVGTHVTGARVKVQERSSVIGQKRPVRAILPAPFNTGRALVQWITVPPHKGKVEETNCSKSTTELSEMIAGLKPNTLKQLGQIVTTTPLEQTLPTPVDRSQYIVTDKVGKILSVVPLKQNSTSTLDLGLSTARGRGRCKNPSCGYVYKNRHKPAECPCCGLELSRKNAKGSKAQGGSVALLDPYRTLSPAQRELQRQSTLQLLRQTLQISESEAELHDTLALIQELNSTQVVLTTTSQAGDQVLGEGEGLGEVQVQSGWPRFYESAATHCALCHYPLFKGGQSSLAGQEDCWLLTDTLIQTASLQLKVCLNPQCLALHSFTDLHPGLFNVGNRLLVSLDLFFKIRSQVRLGRHPNQIVRTILDHIHNHAVHTLSPEELAHVQELLVSGYWAFECLTVRDYNDMICGVCGIAPKMEIAQRYTHNVLELRNVEFTWPDFGAPDKVHVDDFWLTMESEAIEQAAFPCSVPITRVDASIIAPFIPPLMRSSTVINTEKDKALLLTQHTGDPSVLVRLIHEGQLRPDRMDEHSAEELKAILECCGEITAPESNKDELLVSLISLCTCVQNGLSTAPQPPPHLTAGKLSKICPHQVVCGSKYLVKGETARDHVDLLVSSRYWPPVYVTDSARQVALCTDVQYPELASTMWGRNQGCFSDPMDKPEFVSCAELQDQPYSADLSSVVENPQVHPVTKSSSRWIVHPAGPTDGQEPPCLDHHSMGLCNELEPYCSLVQDLERDNEKEEDEGKEGRKDGFKVEAEVTEGSEVIEEECSEGWLTSLRRRPLAFDNTAYYYLYNRLQDFLSSREVVDQQINTVLKACQPGEVVIRDALYRLGVAQINTEEGEEGEGDGGLEGDTGYEEVVVL